MQKAAANYLGRRARFSRSPPSLPLRRYMKYTYVARIRDIFETVDREHGIYKLNSSIFLECVKIVVKRIGRA